MLLDSFYKYRMPEPDKDSIRKKVKFQSYEHGTNSINKYKHNKFSYKYIFKNITK